MLFSAPDASVPVPEEPASSWTHVSVAASTSLFCFEVRFLLFFMSCVLNKNSHAEDNCLRRLSATDFPMAALKEE
jgi:hypothetical protein